VLLAGALVALTVLLPTVGAAGATVAARLLVVAELELVLLELVLLVLVLVLLLVTAVLATTAGASRATLGGLDQPVEGLACPAPEAEYALGIDQMGPNTTPRARTIESPAWSHLRCASRVNKTRCPACMPISPLPTRTDAGVGYATLGHDLNG
jgi:hypothetical protein